MFCLIFSGLFHLEDGYKFTDLVSVVAVTVAIYVLLKRLLFPVLQGYRLAKTLDNVYGTDSKHWFYGHLKKYNVQKEGLRNLKLRTASFPKAHNTWYGPFISTLSCYHPDVTAPILGSGAPKNELGYRFLRRWLGDGLVTSNTSKWKRNRRLLTPAFHHKILRMYNKIFNGCSRVLLDKLLSSGTTIIDISEPIGLMALDILMQCTMSSKTNCQNMTEKHPYIDAVNELSTLLLKRLENPLYLLDCIFLRTKNGRRFNDVADILHLYTEKLIKERREVLNSNRVINAEKEASEFYKRKGNDLDFLDILIETRDEDGKGLTDSEIRDEVDTFLFAGHDTVTSGLSFAVYNLAKYPEFQIKCRDEVLSVIGENDDVKWEDLSKLTYLTMFLKESMRLYSPAPAISRKLNKPLKNKDGDKVLPSGTTAVIMISLQHRNEHLWDDPLVFDPGRFTPENVAKRHSHAYIPFSAGARNCIGQNFAMNEMKIVLAQLLRSLRFYLDVDTPEPVPSPRIVLRSDNGVFVKYQQL